MEEERYILYDTETQQALSQAVEMTATEARQRNAQLRQIGDPARWIPVIDDLDD